MTFRTTIWMIVLLVFAADPAAYGRSEKKSAKYLFKIATLAPDRSVWINTYKAMADEILDATDGNVKFKCFPGGIQGDEATVLRKIRIGQLQGAGLTGTGLSMICKDSLVFQLPIVFRNQEEVDFVFPKMASLFEGQCKKNGYEVLGWPHLGFSYLFSKTEVRDIASLRSSKPWLLQNDTISKVFFDVAGVSAIPADVSDVLTGLQSGLIHTVFSPPIGMISLQWFSRIQNHLDLKLIYSFGAFVVSQKKWNRIPEDLKKKTRDIAQRHISGMNNKIREQNREALRVMADKHIKTLSATEQGLREFKQLTDKVANKLVGDSFSHESLALLRSLLSQVRDQSTRGK